VAGRTLLSVKQAAPADQGVLLKFRECGEDAGMDHDLGLRRASNRQETAPFEAKPTHYFPNSQHLSLFRKRVILL